MTPTDLWDERSVIEWARARHLLTPHVDARSEALSGGISNVVFAVESGDRQIVVKQSLPELRVADSWAFDRKRVVTEHRAMSYLSTVIPGRVPDVLSVDDENFTFAMSMAPPPGEVWKAQLLRGDLRVETARAAGATLGEIQRASSGNRERLAHFADRMPLVQGRTDPYHRTAAAKNPDVADVITSHVDRLIAAHEVLTLGDFAPKNLLTYPDRVFVIDLEVAHLGHPAFDPAFLLTHLVLKSLVLPTRGADLLGLAEGFWDSYRSSAGDVAAADAETRIALGALLLARVDGKSPVEYLGDRGADVRAVAKSLLLTDRTILESVERSLDTLGDMR